MLISWFIIGRYSWNHVQIGSLRGLFVSNKYFIWAYENFMISNTFTISNWLKEHFLRLSPDEASTTLSSLWTPPNWNYLSTIQQYISTCRNPKILGVIFAAQLVDMNWLLHNVCLETITRYHSVTCEDHLQSTLTWLGLPYLKAKSTRWRLLY